MESENTTITRDKTKYIAVIVIISIILMSVAAFFLPDEGISLGIPVSITSPDFIERGGFHALFYKIPHSILIFYIYPT